MDEGRVLLGAAAAARRRPVAGEHRLASCPRRSSSAPACVRSARSEVEGDEGGGAGEGRSGGEWGVEAEGGAEVAEACAF